ncbi:MAG: alpha/beta fold hydrolase [Candidatus Acidiferrales bacterium]
MKDFIPFRPFRNPHAMTLGSAFWPREFPQLIRSVPRLFETEPGTQVLGNCHWQKTPREHPTLVLLHGLEGSSESNYMSGTAEKAYVAGFNAIRLNQRNCGGTEKLTPTLYHSGLSCDIRVVITELIERDGLPEMFAAGFSMGGNIVLKMAAEFGDAAPRELSAVATVAPALDLAACADALAEPRNFIYEGHFVRGLKRRMRYKASLFPDRYAAVQLNPVHTVREFDEFVTARFCGFENADDYYARSSAGRVAGRIRIPALILTAEDDPFVPIRSFEKPAIRENPQITFVAPQYGGHCGFISREHGPERFWSEARIVDFCSGNSKMLGRR